MNNTNSNTNKNSFIKIRLYSVPANLEDVITTHSFECGATGLTEALSFSQPDLTYEPDIIKNRANDLDVYFTERPGCEFFDQLLVWAPFLRWEITEEENKDWLAEWKKGFAPFKLVGPYWVVPSWFEKPAEAEKPIFIDPGMAFGTGTHATTKMAAYFAHKIGSMAKSPNQTMIDVGTGTAILAIIANGEGVKRILGVEIDPEARRVAKENVERNKHSANDKSIEITDKMLEEVREQFDFVVANIIDGVLIRLKDELLRVLKPGGQMFLTGILTERDDEFFAEFIEKSGLKVVRRLEKDEWVGYWLKS